MIALGIDTSLTASSAAILRDGGVIGHARLDSARGQADSLFGLIEEACRTAEVSYADIERIGVAVGPGSFTGIRVGVAAARGLGLALGVPVIGVSTFEALAIAASEKSGATLPRNSRFLIAIDARRGEIYAQAFCMGESGPEASGEATTLRLVDAAKESASLPRALFGSGAPLLAAQSPQNRLSADTLSGHPDARVVALLTTGRPAPAFPPSPFYLRAPDAKLPSAVALA